MRLGACLMSDLRDAQGLGSITENKRWPMLLYEHLKLARHDDMCFRPDLTQTDARRPHCNSALLCACIIKVVLLQPGQLSEQVT